MESTAPVKSRFDRMGKVLLLGVEDVLGPQGVKEVLSHACLAQPGADELPVNHTLKHSLLHSSHLQNLLEKEFGHRAGLGVAVRSGRASFFHLLREYGTQLGLTGLEFRLLPLLKRLETGCQRLAELLNQQPGLKFSYQVSGTDLIWKIETDGDEKHMPACALALGLLQEAMSWASGGRLFSVEETQCVAGGADCCTLRISRLPVH